MPTYTAYFTADRRPFSSEPIIADSDEEAIEIAQGLLNEKQERWKDRPHLQPIQLFRVDRHEAVFDGE